jgi:hypothetical protein
LIKVDLTLSTGHTGCFSCSFSSDMVMTFYKNVMLLMNADRGRSNTACGRGWCNEEVNRRDGGRWERGKVPLGARGIQPRLVGLGSMGSTCTCPHTGTLQVRLMPNSIVIQATFKLLVACD